MTVIKKHETLTHNIKQLGFSGLRVFVLASAFLSVDRNALRNPLRNMHQPLVFIVKNVSNKVGNRCNYGKMQ
jgi:hypothetical protein